MDPQEEEEKWTTYQTRSFQCKTAANNVWQWLFPVLATSGFICTTVQWSIGMGIDKILLTEVGLHRFSVSTQFLLTVWSLKKILPKF